MSQYKKLLNHLDRIQNGKEIFIPNPHLRMREIFNIHKGRYILVGSNSGTGKTSYVDDTLILKPYEWLKQQSFDYHYEVPYFSMERSTQDKLCKWLSWKIYQDKGIKIPSNVFSVGSQGDIKLEDKHTLLAREYEPWMEDILSHVTIYQGPQYPSTIAERIQEIVKRVISILRSDDRNIFWNGEKIGEFSPEITKEENGGLVMYRNVTNRHDKSETITITPKKTVYIPKKHNTFVKIVLDHLGKLKGSTKKSAIDEVDEILSIARDEYQFMPIAVSQFNRAIGDITRIKFTNGNLEPILEDFKDSGNTQESADLIIGPFDPYRYKSFDKDGLYKGYNIADMNSPGTLDLDGRQRFRSIHILKNSYGDAQITFGMRFTGEVMDFKLLPLPGTKELQQVYNEIMLNK
jgi:hypothetical protein